jgi:hypothetical protein
MSTYHRLKRVIYLEAIRGQKSAGVEDGGDGGKGVFLDHRVAEGETHDIVLAFITNRAQVQLFENSLLLSHRLIALARVTVAEPFRKVAELKRLKFLTEA